MPKTRMGPWFTASYPGECDECGGFFEAGDTIRSDGAGGWLCDDPECGGAEDDA